MYDRHDTMCDNIRGKISFTALELVQMQISAPCPRKECRSAFHSIYGMICGHTMDNKIAIGGKLEMVRDNSNSK